MPNEFSQKAQDIFYAALELEPSERTEFLSKACAGDTELRVRVERLLRATISADDVTVSESEIYAGRLGEANLATGDILSNRFLIVNFIASGGMGSVYEAEDLALHERVALKTIRPDLAADAHTIERFKREIQLARKITHPNVCRIFDFSEDRSPKHGQIVFLTMELLAGETLSTRIRRAGPLTAEEALPIVQQAAAGLTAAHEAGIVHRDFKGANIILTPAGSGIRAVVTDFGLAYANRPGMDSPSLTRTGAVTGTPLYMAPEQVRGGPITQAVDVYALGVVMFEMVTGTWPFTGENALEIANKRLTEKPASPRSHNPKLGALWEKAILRCLEVEPLDRFASAHDVAAFLEGQKVAPPKRRLRRRLALAGIILAIMLSAVAAHWLIPKPRLSRRTIAVLGFQNIAALPQVAWVSTGLAEGLRAQLAAPTKLRTVSGEEVAAYKRDIGIHNFDSLSKPTLKRLYRLGADLVVVGSYTDLGKDSGGRIHLNIEIQDTERGETIGALSADGTEAELTELVSQAGTRLRDKLGIGGLSPEKEAQVSATQPTADAAPFYSTGLDKLRAYDLPAAQQLFQKAILADPKYAYGHAALAETWRQLGYDARAQEEAKKAYDGSRNLPLEDRLSIEGQYRMIASDWNGAVHSYGELVQYFPDNLEYGLHLAEAQMISGNSAEALKTLDVLSKLPPPQGDDPRITLQRAEVDASTGDSMSARMAAISAIDTAKARGMKVLQVRALAWACNAFERLGDPKKAKSLCQEEADLSSVLGDKLGAARAFNGLATIERNQGNTQEALVGYQHAFEIASSIGDKRDMAGALNNIGIMLNSTGHPAEAQQKYEQALEIEREAKEEAEEAMTLGNLAGIAWQKGDLEKAVEQYAASVDLARRTGSRAELARGLTNLGGVLSDLGQLDRAAAQYGQALSLRRQMGAKRDIAITLDSLGELRLAKADVKGAAAAYNEALKIQQEIGDKSWAATTQAGLAEVLIEQGEAGQAEAMARASAQEFQAEGDSENEVISRLTVARALLKQNRAADAQNQLESIASSKANVSPSTQIDIVIAQAELAAETGNRAAVTAAIANVRKAIAAAERQRVKGRELKARLALARLELKAGEKVSARTELAGLSQEASRDGYVLVARKAREMGT